MNYKDMDAIAYAIRLCYDDEEPEYSEYLCEKLMECNDKDANNG